MRLDPTFRIQPGILYLAPALDIAFLLGIFFLFQNAFLLQPGVAVDVPRSPFLLSPQKNANVLGITGPPNPAYYFDNRPVEIDELFHTWQTGSNRPGTLVIKADVDTPYEWILRAASLALEIGIPVVLATDDRPPSGSQ